MTHTAVAAEGIAKRYSLGERVVSRGTLYDSLSQFMSRRARAPAVAPETLWALRDVSFEIQDGEVIGIIGRNGAGKSTLLKILSRITAPTEGRALLRGRIASLLEVGTGFHPELTGRENIYLNGSILGMRRAEIDRQFDAIVEFAEVESFVDTPVKRYSSGMYVRLAFSVAAHLDPDILVIDEVLAVGDSGFQKRCLGKMRDIAGRGRTVLFVSHNLGAVRNLCSRALLLEAGRVAFDGAPDSAIARYERSFASGGIVADTVFEGPLASDIRIDKLTCVQAGSPVNMIDPLQPFELRLGGEAMRDFPALELNVAFLRDGVHIGSCFDTPGEAPMPRGRFESVFRLPAGVFRPGRYSLGIGASANIATWMWSPEAAVLDFSENLGGEPAHRQLGVLAIPYESSRTT